MAGQFLGFQVMLVVVMLFSGTLIVQSLGEKEEGVPWRGYTVPPEPFMERILQSSATMP